MAAGARRERARRASVRAGAVTVVAVVALTAFAVTAQNGMPEYVPGVDRSRVTATFSDVGALRAGDEVRIAGVRAGFVEDIQLDEGVPVVVMRLEGERAVHADATASLGSRSALGQKYVELEPGTPAAGGLDEGGIADDATVEAVELDDVLSTLDGPTREAAASTLRETGGGLAGLGPDLHDGLATAPGMLTDLQVVTEALTRDGGADLTTTLQTARDLAVELAGDRDELAGLTDQLGTTLDAIAVDDGQALADTLVAAPAALTAARTALDDLQEPLAATEAAAAALRPGAVALAAATPDLRGLLVEAVPPLARVPGVAPSLETAVLDLTPTLRDLRPVVTQVGTALTRLQAPLEDISPYSEEVMLFFANAGSALGQRDQTGGWLRVMPVINPEILTANLPFPSPLTNRHVYPAPGEAASHRTNGNGLFDSGNDQ